MSKQSSNIALKTPKELLDSNPKISKSVVAQYQELEKQLKKLGVDTKPKYTLSPPLGGVVSNFREQ